jgi:excisionase family DNA binding protein
MNTRLLSPSQSRPVPRRGLSREEAAMYVGVSLSKFDDMVKDGRMPKARRIDGRKVWDIYELDSAFDALPHDGDSPSIVPNSWADRM